MKAIGYIRVSTDEQDYNSQINQIEKYCELNNFELVHIVKEKGISGSTSINKRPAGQTIQQFIDDGAQAIIAVKLDRMFRSTVDALTTTDEWIKQEVALHILDFCGFGTLSTMSPLGRMVFTMQAAFAEMELSQIQSRTRTAMQYKKQKGEFTGQLPFGYKKEGNKIIELPERSQAIALINRLEGKSARFIASCVEEETGLKCSHVTINKLIKEQTK